jgi:hypothetical protein
VGILIDRATVSEFEPGKFSAECPVCARRVPIDLAHPWRHHEQTESRASVRAHPSMAQTPYFNVEQSRWPGLCAASDETFPIGDPVLAEVPQELIDEGFLPN